MKNKNKYDFTSLLRIIKIARNYKLHFGIAIFSSFLLALFISSRLHLIKIAVDDYIVKREYSGFTTVILLICLALVLEVFFQYAFTYLANWLGQQVIKDLRVELFKKIMSFRLKYHDRTPIGLLVTRCINDIETIAMIFSNGILVVFGDIITLIIICAAMFLMNWRLSLFLFLIIPIVIIATRWFQKKIKSSFEEIRNQVAALNIFVQERLSGMALVQVFNRQKAEYKKFKVLNEKHKKAHIKTILYFSFFFPIIDFLHSIGLVILLLYASFVAIYSKSVSFGELIAFIPFMQALFRPMRQIADKLNQMQNGLVSVNRVLKIMHEKESIKDNGHLMASDILGKIEFRNVRFSYVEGKEILKGISFSVSPGQLIAIVGYTGAGKSTIIRLISRFYEISSGEIYIDDRALKNYNIQSLRKNIAAVPQDVFLFSDSILNNISLSTSIEKNTIVKAAKEIGVHNFITSLPNGYNFNIKERGNTLSFGQKQLISFLRAYVSNPRVLILDEATSSVDPNTEELIQTAMKKITKNRTSIIIAHRLSTIQKADKIIVMSRGKVVETGTHASLLEKKEIYFNLFQSQFLKSNKHTPSSSN